VKWFQKADLALRPAQLRGEGPGPSGDFAKLLSVKNKTSNPTMKALKSIGILALVAGVICFTSAGCKSEGHNHAMPSQESSAVRPYPLDKCVVSGEPFEHGKPYVFVHNGQEVKLCCKDCLADFNKDPDKYMAKISSAK
jgi:hypothetical protein